MLHTSASAHDRDVGMQAWHNAVANTRGETGLALQVALQVEVPVEMHLS